MTASSSAATLDRLAREKERHMPMNWSSRGRRRARYLLTVQLVVTLAVLLAAGQASGVPLERGSVAAPKAKPLDKVERRVLDQTAARRGSASSCVPARSTTSPSGSPTRSG